MKRKNAKIWIVVIISVQFLILCSVMTNANAWKNGTPSGTVTEAGIANWRAGEHYGTHDGIAEAALDAVKADNNAQPWQVNAEGQQIGFWDERRTTIFLIGTEAPDMAQSQLSLTLNGVPVTGQRTSRRHNVWFNRYDPSSPGTSMQLQIAQVTNTLNDYVKKAEAALRNEDCDLAAFYMGACSHLIADLSNWAHTISWTNLKEVWDPAYDYNVQSWIPSYLNNKVVFSDKVTRLHTSFEADILEYTNVRKPSGLFSYPMNFRVSPNGIKNPPEIALVLAFNTRFDCDVTSQDQINGATIGLSEGPDNALWMFHQSYDVDWMSNDASYRNVQSQNGMSGQRFRERVDELLDNGVKAVAQLLDYFGQVWNTTGRKCKCTVTEKPQENALKMSNKLAIGVAMFIYMGIAASFFSAIMLTQLKSAMNKEESPFPVNVIQIPG